jgi:hypothetical protein
VVVTKAGWRPWIKGLSVAAGICVFLFSGAALMDAAVLRDYGVTPYPYDVIAGAAAIAAVLLVGWPWVFWKPSPDRRVPRKTP